MTIEYTPTGVCSKKIEVTVEDGIVHNVRFTGGCNGNTQGVSRLVEGLRADEAIEKLSGIRCGMRGTSCPDQLSKAIAQAVAAG